MFIEAEFQIFKQFQFNLNIPTAIEFALQILFLDQDIIKESNSESSQSYSYLRYLDQNEKDQLGQLALQSIYQCNFEEEISLVHSQMQIAMASLIF